jgi:hypothetical protein
MSKNILFQKNIKASRDIKADELVADSSLVIPRLTTTQRDASGAVNGNIIYNTTTNKFEAYVNNVWVEVVVGSGGGFVTLADAQTITGVKTFKNNETKFESTAGTLYCTIKDDKTINLPEVGSSYNIKNNVALSESQILPFSTNTTIANNIKITGGVGMKIGDTVDPTSILHLKSINPSLQIEGTTSSLLLKGGTQNLLSFGFGTEISHITGNNLKFINGVNTLLEIDSVGKMGIADSAPQAHVSLDVGSSVSGTGIIKLPKVTTSNQRADGDPTYNGGLWYNIDTNQFMIMQNGTKQALHHSSNSLDIASVQSSTGIKTFTNGSNHGNINIATDTISNSNTNSDIILSPNGTGDVNISSGNLLFSGTGGTNVAILDGSLNSANSNNLNCISIGKNSQQSNINSTNNISIGTDSLKNNISSSGSCAYGVGTQENNISGNKNCSYGFFSLNKIINTDCNSSFGYGSMTSAVGSLRNCAFGCDSMTDSSLGASYCCAYGDGSLKNVKSSFGCICIGSQSGSNLQSGNDVITIGTSSNVDTPNRNNVIVLGNAVSKPFDNSIYIGSVLNGGIGYTRAYIQGIRNIIPDVASPHLVVIDSDHQLGSIPNPIVNNNAAATDPLTTDDSTQGYSVFSLWKNTTNNNIWKCSNNSVGNSVWGKLFTSDVLQPATICSNEFTSNSSSYVVMCNWIFTLNKKPKKYSCLIYPLSSICDIRLYNLSTGSTLQEQLNVSGGPVVILFNSFIHTTTEGSLYQLQMRKSGGSGSFRFSSLRSD